MPCSLSMARNIKGNGPLSNKEMEQQVKAVYEDFNTRRKAYDARQADMEDLKFLKNLENEVRQSR